MMWQITKKEIVRPEATKFATNFPTLHSLHEKKGKLRFMLSYDDWLKFKLAKTAKGKKVEATVISESFLKYVVKLYRIYAHLLRMLRSVDKNYNPLWVL